jgi:formamidopyrimidine-DNA glycosylase
VDSIWVQLTVPELGDVEGYRRLVEQLRGACIQRVELIDPAVARSAGGAGPLRVLEGQTIRWAKRVGKLLVICTDGPAVVVHLGMTGALHLRFDADRDRFDRVALVTDRGDLCLRDPRRLGGIWLAEDTRAIDDIVGPLGPDALGVTAEQFRVRLDRGRGPIKSALLDQSRIAGIGNFLSDEILWRARLHPATAVDSLTDESWRTLHRSSSSVLHAVARAGHTPRGPNWLTGARWRDPRICPRCASPLDTARIGGRTSVWCPRCQGSRP